MPMENPSASSPFSLHDAVSFFGIPPTQNNSQYFDINRNSATPHLNGNHTKSFNDARTMPKLDRTELERLGLKGNIINVVPRIPFAIGIAIDGQVQLTPRYEELVPWSTIPSHLKSTSQRDTLIGWTGEVLPVRQGSVLGSTSENPLAMQPHQTEHLDTNQNIPINKRVRVATESRLKQAFDANIVPVWMGDWIDGPEEILLLRNQHRWRAYTDGYLYRALKRAPQLPKNMEERIDDAFANYKKMNEAFADAILRVYKPGDIIWIFDHVLMLLPEIIRRRLPSAYIAYFHHAGWCQKQDFVKMRNCKEIMEGILGASIIGMPNETLLLNVRDCFQHILKLTLTRDGVLTNNGREIQLQKFPLRVHKADLEGGTIHQMVVQYMREIAHRYKDKRLIVAFICRSQPEYHRYLIESFKYLLEKHPQWRNRAILVLKEIPDWFQTKEEGTLSQTAHVNRQWGSLLHQPIIYLDNRPLSMSDTALLKSADLAILPGEHEHIENMSARFVLCQSEKHNPLLIYDGHTDGVAEKPPDSSVLAPPQAYAPSAAKVISAALSMDGELKESTHKKLLRYFESYDISNFTNKFCSEAYSSLLRFELSQKIMEPDLTLLHTRFSVAAKRLLMFDYDGTLTPIVNDPDQALPTEKLISGLTDLAANSCNEVWVISGRSRAFLENQFGRVPYMGLSAEHGSFIRRPGALEWKNLAARMDMSWKVEVESVFADLVTRFDRSWIEKKEVAIVWHYRNVLNQQACFENALVSKAHLERTLTHWDVEIMLGKANVEVRPKFLNKGATVTELLNETFTTGNQGFVLCAGDDITDEDMFRALTMSKLEKDCIFSCLVSKDDKPSLAYYRVEEPHKLIEIICNLSIAQSEC